MEELNKDEYNELTRWIACSGNTQIFDMMKKIGYRDVGSLANGIIRYQKLNLMITEKFKEVIELTKDVNLNNLDEVDRERFAVYTFCKELLNQTGSVITTS